MKWYKFKLHGQILEIQENNIHENVCFNWPLTNYPSIAVIFQCEWLQFSKGRRGDNDICLTPYSNVGLF